MAAAAAATIVGAIITGASSIIAAGEAKTQQHTYTSEVINNGNTMKNEYGNGVSTIINLYNETGSNARLHLTESWHGHIWKYPYPSDVGNGQWAVCLHVHSSGAARGSTGAMIYRVKNHEGQGCDVYMGWDTPYSGKNKVHVECREIGHWWGTGSKSYMKDLTSESGETSSDIQHGIRVVASIGQYSSPVLQISVGLG